MNPRKDRVVDKPSEVDDHVGRFDRFADRVSGWTSRAWFFALCVATVALWTPTIFMLDINSSQLIINTTTTIVTFLLVALLQNTQSRSDNALHRKLNALADGLADLLENEHGRDAVELRAAVGLEKRESS